MSPGVKHLENCDKQDCDTCDYYNEFCMACDNCGSWGDMDVDSWVLGQFGVYCTEECKEKSGGEQ